MNHRFARALVAFLALPGIVAFLVPLLVVKPATTPFVLHEEPWLARTFGDAWTQYRTRVSRWM